MADCCSPTFLFVLIRAVHYTTCLLLLAVWAFDALVLPTVMASAPESILMRWERQEGYWTFLLLPLIAISGIAWFMVLCVNMSGLSLREAMGPDTVRAVWNQTHFGRVWQVRSILWLGALTALPITMRMRRFFRTFAVWITVIIAGSLVASLAWAGHGQDGGSWHLAADAVHLFIAGLWPMGLVPFALLLFQLRKVPFLQQRECIAALVRKFSLVSLLSVSILASTGFINGLFMVTRLSDLITTSYGKLLLLKGGLFLLMVLLGAMNLLFLKPQIAEFGPVSEASTSKLQWSVGAEVVLGLIVLIATAALGLLAPGSK